MGKFHRIVFVGLSWFLTAGCNDSLNARSAADEAARKEAEKHAANVSSSGEDGTPTSQDSGPKKTDPVEKPEGTGDASGFDEDMAKIVLERGRKQAVQCPNVAKDTPTGEGDLELVFDGKSGRIVDVGLGSTFSAGSSAGQECIKNAFLGQIVTRFEGKKKMSFTLKIERAPETDGKKKKP
jgi:hypothetical protein